MKKLLITGTSGFLAARVRDYFLEDGGMEVLTPSHAELDITSLDQCKAWFEQNRPDAVIHLAAMSEISDCANHPEESRRVNTEGPRNLALCAKESGMTGRFLYASSDQVYTGNHTADRLNCESDHLSPENLYAQEKLAAEEQVSAILPDAVAMRLDWMFDLRPGKMNYIKYAVKSVRGQTPNQYAVNELRAQTYAYEVAANMKKMLLSDAEGGAYNFGGPAAGNSYETAVRVFDHIGEVLGLPVKGLVVPVTWERPQSLAMDQTKLNSVGLSFRNTVDSVAFCLERERAFL